MDHVGTAIKLVSLCKDIYDLAKKVQNIDQVIVVLGVEVNSLSIILNTFASEFSHCSVAKFAKNLQTGYEAEHWINVAVMMDGCRQTLETLGAILHEVKGPGDQFLRRARIAYRLDDKLREIALQQRQITAYRDAIQLSIQLITV